MSSYGFMRLALGTPELKVANIDYNTAKIKEMIAEAIKNRCGILVFPELALSGKTSYDLFFQKELEARSFQALKEIADFLKGENILVFLGLAFRLNKQLYNAVALISAGKIQAIFPKSRLEKLEKRWFSEFKGTNRLIKREQLEIPFGKFLVRGVNDFWDFTIGVNIGNEDYFRGSDLLVNLRSDENFYQKEFSLEAYLKAESFKARKFLLVSQTSRQESTTNGLYGCENMILKKGRILGKTDFYRQEGQLLFRDLDLETNYQEEEENYESLTLKLSKSLEIKEIKEKIDAYPFVPEKKEELERIFQRQVLSLVKRLEHTGIEKLVLGVSGGLDSSLALLVAVEAMDFLGLARKNILGITMPGFGTSQRTYKNSLALMEKLGISSLEIDIKEASQKHLERIGHSLAEDTTFENAQARERTKILMDMANQENALVIGTGDMSELALGWCTYNGDHMSMYAVNSGVAKTLVKALVSHLSLEKFPELEKINKDILKTPISPELTSSQEGEKMQITEDFLGPYEVQDFYLYHFLKNRFSEEKMVFLAKKAFGKKYSQENLKKYLAIFKRRFFANQFKRSCLPDGPKVSEISLSPRQELILASDVGY